MKASQQVFGAQVLRSRMVAPALLCPRAGHPNTSSIRLYSGVLHELARLLGVGQ